MTGWYTYYTQYQNTVDDGDTVIIHDTISIVTYYPEKDYTSIAFSWKTDPYTFPHVYYYFNGDISGQYSEDDEVKITVTIRHKTFSAIGLNWDLEIFEEQWGGVGYFKLINHWSEFEQNALLPMSPSVIEKVV